MTSQDSASAETAEARNRPRSPHRGLYQPFHRQPGPGSSVASGWSEASVRRSLFPTKRRTRRRARMRRARWRGYPDCRRPEGPTAGYHRPSRRDGLPPVSLSPPSVAAARCHIDDWHRRRCWSSGHVCGIITAPLHHKCGAPRRGEPCPAAALDRELDRKHAGAGAGEPPGLWLSRPDDPEHHLPERRRANRAGSLCQHIRKPFTQDRASGGRRFGARCGHCSCDEHTAYLRRPPMGGRSGRRGGAQ